MKKLAYISAGAVLCTAVFVLWTTHERSSLLKELDRFLIPNANLETASPAELRLYRYLVETRRDPVFAFPGVDTEQLKSALDAFEGTRDAFLARHTEGDREILRNYLYPIDFLRSMTATERARQTFLKDPTPQYAAGYHASLMETITMYREKASGVRKILGDFDEKTLGFWHGLTSTDRIKNVFSTIILESDARADVARKRFNCFKYGFSCSSLLQDADSLRTHRTTPTAGNIDPARPPAPTIALHRNLIEAPLAWETSGPAYSITTQSVEEMPVVSIENSPCALNDEVPYVRFWWSNSRVSKIPSLKMFFLNDLYFRNIARPSNPVEKEFVERGVTYLFQPLNPFVCIDYGSDVGSVLTAYMVQNLLKEDPVSASSENAPEAVYELISLQEHILKSADILSVQGVTAFVSSAENTLNALGEKALAGYIGENAVLRLEEIITLWRSKSAWFGYHIGTLDDASKSILLLSKEGPIPLEEMFLLRSYVSSLFQISNATIVKEPLLLLEDKRPFEPQNFGVVGFRESLSTTLTPAQVLELLQEYAKNLDHIIDHDL